MKYQTAVPIGSGGMGEVYKAFDPVLKRWVALKYPRWDRPDLAERFLREAELQARVDHEGVCRVYEVGREQDGRAFIAMQYVEGAVLETAAQEMTLIERVEVMRRVAEAVHAAHQTGLVHRDLKPHNIMVEREGGVWRPYVMDFGLAREHAAEGLTRSGVVLGTPAYMAPEQALGHTGIDRRADVYSLGAVLYRLAAGRPPFEGGDVDVILKVAHADAPALRTVAPTVAGDLDTIVMKCLEKEPARRYDSAGALAEDLGRYLAGQPIVGRPTGHAARLWRRVLRNRVAVAAVALGALLALGSGAMAVLARRDTARRLAAAQRFGEESERVEATLRQAYLLPLHDTRPEAGAARARMEAVRQEMERLGAAGRGPGHHALGRGYLLLGHWEEARRELDRAWEAGERTPDVALARGHALARLYQEALLDLERFSDAATREARRRQAESALRDPALADLRRGASASREPAAYVEALVAFCDRRYDDALARAGASAASAPPFYEARLLEGDVRTLLAEEKRHAGDYEAAASHLRGAEEAYRSATEVARSAPAALARECRVRVQQLELEMERGAQADAAYAPASSACARALQADPDGPDALSSSCRLEWRWADFKRDAAGEAEAALERAVQLGRRAVDADAGHLEARLNLASAFWGRAAHERLLARPPLESFRAAIEQYEAAARIQPDNPRAVLGMGSVLNERARYEAAAGLDPVPSLDAAIRSLEQAALLLPLVDAPRNNLGNTFLYRAEYEASRGADPTHSYAQAVRWYDEGTRVNPNSHQEYVGRSLTLVSRALFLLGRGQAPEPLAAEAQVQARKALELNPRLALAEANLGRVEMLRADDALARSQDPRPALGRARAGFEKALAVNPHFSPAAVSLATSWHQEGEFLLRGGHDPAPAVRQGQAALERARRLDGDPHDLDLWSARLSLLTARWAARAGGPAGAGLAAADARLSALAGREPAEVEVRRTQAQAARVRAEWEWARHRRAEAAQAVGQGLAAADAALASNPADAESLALRGALLAQRAALTDAPDARGLALAAAQETHRRALQANPLLANRYPPPRG